jgi:hypothetical protein
MEQQVQYQELDILQVVEEDQAKLEVPMLVQVVQAVVELELQV